MKLLYQLPNKVVAIDAETGDRVWTNEDDITGVMALSPAVVDGIVYVGSQDGTLYMLTDPGTIHYAA